MKISSQNSLQTKSRQAIFLSAAALAIFTASACENTGSEPQEAGSGEITIGISNGGQQFAAPPRNPQLGPQHGPIISKATVTSIEYSKATIVLGDFALDNGLSNPVSFMQDSSLVANIDLNGAITILGTITVPTGSYSELTFAIKTLNPTDSAKYEDNLDMRDLSLRIEGRVNASADSSFVYTDNFNLQRTIQVLPFIINDGDKEQIILTLDVEAWFATDSTEKFDPRAATNDDSTKSTIEDNIINGITIESNKIVDTTAIR